jgi:hypothetical protein
MGLLKVRTDSRIISSQVEFEKFADDLLMISIAYDINEPGEVPSYWRLMGNERTPPLEIGVNVEKKMICRITVFIDNDNFRDDIDVTANAQLGSLIIDTAIFTKVYDFVDEVGNYYVSLSDNKFICIFNGKQEIAEIIGNNRVEMFVNGNSEVCGFAINNLQESQKNDIISVVSHERVHCE